MSASAISARHRSASTLARERVRVLREDPGQAGDRRGFLDGHHRGHVVGRHLAEDRGLAGHGVRVRVDAILDGLLTVDRWPTVGASPIIEHMIETLARAREQVRTTTSPPPTCSRWLVTAGPPRTRPPPSSSRSPPGGPTSTRPSRSTPPPRSPSPAASTRNPSPARAARWWRSSASPSSAPSSGSRPPRRRSSSATPSSCATASPDCGRRCRPARVPAWRARLVAEATIHTSPALTVEAAGWIDSQVAAVAGRIGTAQLDRLVAETIKRYDLAAAGSGRRSRGRLPVGRPAPRRRSTATTSTSPARCTSRPTSTSPTPSTSTGPGPRRRTAEGTRLDRDARRTPRQGPRRPRPHPDRPRPVPARAQTGANATEDGLPAAREVVLHAHFDATHRRRADRVRSHRPDGGRPAAGPARPDQVLVRRLPHQGHHQARHRPQRRALHTGVRRSPTASANRSSSATRPACSRGAPDPPGAATSTTSSSYDHDAAAEGRPQPGPTTTSNLAALCRYHHRLKTHTAWHYRMAATRGLRVDQPPRPPLPTRPHRHHPRSTNPSHPTDHDPAPHPAAAPSGGAERVSACARRDVARPRCCAVG